MMDESYRMGEEELRERFAELRQEERRLAPPFIAPFILSGPTRRQNARWRRRLWIPFAAAVCATAILSILLWPRLRPAGERKPGLPVASITEWQPPTEFLLETPGRQMLQSTPDFRLAMRPYAEPVPPHGPPHADRLY